MKWAAAAAAAIAAIALVVAAVAAFLHFVPFHQQQQQQQQQHCPPDLTAILSANDAALDRLEKQVAPLILPADRTGKTYIRLLTMAIVEGNRSEMERITRDGLQPHLLKFYC